MAKVARRESVKVVEDKVKLNIDVEMSNVLVQYALSKFPSNMHLSNLRHLLDVIDIESYIYNYDIYNRLMLTKYILEARLDRELTNLTLIKQDVINTDSTMEDLVNSIEWSDELISVGDAKAVNSYVDDKMKYYFFEQMMPEIIEKWHECQKTGFNTDSSTLRDLNDQMATLVTRMQSTSISTGLLRRFRFAAPDVADVLSYIVKRAQKPSAILQTGIRQLNAILGPGFRGGKLYTFLGLSGKFKSGTLLNIADQIRQFNPQLEDVVNGKRNTILFITMENDIEETIERVFSMYAPSDALFVNSTPEEVYDIIMNKGGYKYTDTKGIDIDIRFFQNLEIKTSHIYSIIDEMERDGEHCIAVVLDYIKRIDSTINTHGDEVLRCSYASKELKNIAEYYGIPVITAQQINRTGNQIVDAAMRDGKQDLTKFVGNSDIGGAWSVIEESDWVCIVNLVRQLSSGKLFLTFKLTKQRGAKNVDAWEYFNHPFASETEIRLQTDVDKEGTVSIRSLASDLETVNQNYDNTGAQVRPVLRKGGSVSRQDIMSKINPVMSTIELPNSNERSFRPVA